MNIRAPLQRSIYCNSIRCLINKGLGLDCGLICQLHPDNGYLATYPSKCCWDFFPFTYIMSGDVLGFGKRSLLAKIYVIDEDSISFTSHSCRAG